MGEKMYISKRLWSIVRPNIPSIAMVTWWTLLPIIGDGFRMLSWGMFLLGIIRDQKDTKTIISLVFVVISTLLQRASEHLLVTQKAKHGNLFKGRFRSELFEKLFYLGPAYIEKKTKGEIITTLWEKVEWISYYLYYYIPTSCSILLFSLICSVIFLQFHFLLSIVILGSGALITAMPVLFRRVLKESGSEEWGENDEYYSICLEGLRGIVTLKALNANEIHRNKVETKAEENRQQIMRNLQRTTLNTRSIDLLISLGEFALVGLGVWFAFQGFLSDSFVLLLFMIAGAWTEGSKRLIGAWLRGNKGIAAFEQAAEILEADHSHSILSLENNIEADLTQSEDKKVVFDCVSFSYAAEGAPAVADFSLTIPPGTKTALVGSSGSGKTSIIRLLFGFYKPNQGEIYIGNRLIDAQNVKQIQNMMTVIWQDCHVFYMNCMDNIKIARPDATEEEVVEAAKKANIHERILSLPEGYQSVIGDGGIALSGGEKQRISLARAFLRNAEILILDEATSSLDRRNEEEIQDCISELGRGKTVLTIAHRLDTIRNSDQICVMEAGRIIEMGSHEELMNLRARYYELMGNSPDRRGYIYDEEKKFASN